MIGTTIAHYRIIEKLGAGGMGEVYLAEDAKLDRKVALKFLPAAVEADAEARERLLREAKAASKISHPNILTIYSVEEVDARHFIVMEYIPGVTLDQHVQKHEPTINDILALAIPIAEGLAKAHQSGLVHRDMKPANVLVDEDGRPRILDFGLAKIEGASKLTKTGSTVGTIAYSSPELTQGKEADARSDIFSFGVVLYEMIAGRRPFAGEHEAALVYSIVHEEPEPLARYRTGVPQGIQQIVSKCLSKQSGERYQSCDELVADLKRERRLLDSSPSTASSPATPVRSNRRRTWITVAALAALVTATVLYLRPAQEEPGTVQAPASAPVLAVLPFINQGASADEYFADGITDEITTHLGKITGLRVISRASALQYKGSDLNLMEIADQLGANYMLIGTVRWDKSGSTHRVRISPELTHVADGIRVWGDSYDRELTQIFDVQADIAEHIATALGVSLLSSQRSQLAYKPTESMEAYDYYLRARDKLNRGTELIHFREAIDLLHRAIEEDPDFTVAYATLAQTHTSLYWWYHNRQELDSAQRIFDLILDKDQMLPELQLALGSYYTLVETSYERATVALDNARMALGESSDLYQQTAYLAKRQGNWNKAVADARMALELDPRSAFKCLDLADTYMMLGQHDKADELLDRAISVGSPSGEFFFVKIQNSLLEYGSIDSARRLVEIASQYMDPARVMALGSKTTLEVLGLWRFNLITEDLESLPRRFEGLFDSPRRHVYYVSRAQLFEDLGRIDLKQVYYDSARTHVDSLVQKYPEDFHFTVEKALINSVAGYHEEAIEAAERGKELMPIDLCHW